jgi:ATP-binding cassette subfamily B multidrug efflux pump
MNTEHQIKIDDDQLFGKLYKPNVVKRLIPYLKGRIRLVVIALVATALWSISITAMPFMIKIAIDEYIVKSDWNGLVVLSIGFVLVMLFSSLCSLVMEISCIKIGQHVLYRLKKDMFGKIQQLSLGFFDKTETGRVISRVQGDVYQIGEFFSMMVTGLADFAVLGWIIAAILILNWKLGLIAMIVIPCLVGVMWYWQPRAKIGFVFSRAAISSVNSYLNQNISGVRVVQAMNRQRYNAGQFDSLNQDNKIASLRASKLSSGLIPPVDFLTGVSIALALFFGALFVKAGSMEIGSIVAFVLYIQRFFDPIRSVTMQYTQLQRSMTSGERIFELMDQQSEVIDAENAPDIGVIKGEVEYRNVSF